MISNLKPYPDYKDFNLSWIREITSPWGIERWHKISFLRNKKNEPDLDLLSVFLGCGVIPYSEGGGQVHKPSLDLSGFQVVYPGDLVLNNKQVRCGSLGVSQ